MQAEFEIAPGQEHEIVFTLAAAASVEEARGLIQRYLGVGPARQGLEGVWQYWQRTLGTVYLETPDPGINALVNGWLLYQTLACRLWGRSGYYQSGGAFGFRDQLQDIMALVHAQPRLMREHLLRAAAHQFVQGDVQHWWHPPTGRGVRTHFSDDHNSTKTTQQDTDQNSVRSSRCIGKLVSSAATTRNVSSTIADGPADRGETTGQVPPAAESSSRPSAHLARQTPKKRRDFI